MVNLLRRVCGIPVQVHWCCLHGRGSALCSSRPAWTADLWRRPPPWLFPLQPGSGAAGRTPHHSGSRRNQTNLQPRTTPSHRRSPQSSLWRRERCRQTSDWVEKPINHRRDAVRYLNTPCSQFTVCWDSPPCWAHLLYMLQFVLGQEHKLFKDPRDFCSILPLREKPLLFLWVTQPIME